MVLSYDCLPKFRRLHNHNNEFHYPQLVYPCTEERVKLKTADDLLDVGADRHGVSVQRFLFLFFQKRDMLWTIRFFQERLTMDSQLVAYECGRTVGVFKLETGKQ